MVSGRDQWVLWHAVEPAHVLLYVLFMARRYSLRIATGGSKTASPSLVRTWGIVSVVGLCGIPVLIATLSA